MKLLESSTLGNLQLKNRLVMSAMTRSRATQEGIVGTLTQTYYKQRATAGLILSEAINISPQAIGSPYTPGLYTTEQIEAWKKVTEAVHAAYGKIYAQLWHTGRMGHSVDRQDQLPVAPSAIAIEGSQHFTSQGPKDFETPAALSIGEIGQIIVDYGQAAKNAIAAGFDGVELHAANGYLPNQFLAESANQRTDEYGGSVANKCRFILEVMKELITQVGAERVGIKLSPFQPYGGMVMVDPIATYNYLIAALNELDFSFVELMRRAAMFPPIPGYPVTDEVEQFGHLINKTLIANGGYTKETAEEVLSSSQASLVSFGVLFLANPDLPKRFETNAPLNSPDMATMFGGAEKGYTDYPFLS